MDAIYHWESQPGYRLSAIGDRCLRLNKTDPGTRQEEQPEAIGQFADQQWTAGLQGSVTPACRSCLCANSQNVSHKLPLAGWGGHASEKGGGEVTGTVRV